MSLFKKKSKPTTNSTQTTTSQDGEKTAPTSGTSSSTPQTSQGGQNLITARQSSSGTTKPSQTKPSSGTKGNIIIQSAPLSASDMRFLNARYLIFILLLFVLGVLVIYPRVNQAYSEYTGAQSTLESNRLQVKRQLAKVGTYKKNNGLLSSIMEHKASLLQCFTSGSGCQSLPSTLQENLSIVRYYFQLNDLQTPKMEVDEKAILYHIDTYLLQDDPYSSSIEYLGELQNISIGKPQKEKGDLATVPVHLTITFSSKKALMKMLKRIENNVYFTDQGQLDHTILYTIDQVDYDIMNYTTTQDVKLTLKAWFLQ